MAVGERLLKGVGEGHEVVDVELERHFVNGARQLRHLFRSGWRRRRWWWCFFAHIWRMAVAEAFAPRSWYEDGRCGLLRCGLLLGCGARLDSRAAHK